MKYQSTSKPHLIRQTEHLLRNGKTGREQPYGLLIAIVPTYCSRAGSSFGASFPATVELSALEGSNGFALKSAAEMDISEYSVSAASDVNGVGIDDVSTFGREQDGGLQEDLKQRSVVPVAGTASPMKTYHPGWMFPSGLCLPVRTAQDNTKFRRLRS